MGSGNSQDSGSLVRVTQSRFSTKAFTSILGLTQVQEFYCLRCSILLHPEEEFVGIG